MEKTRTLSLFVCAVFYPIALMDFKKQKNGTYVLDNYIGGKRCHITGKTKKEMNEKLTAWMEAQAAADAKEKQGPLLNTVADEWWADKLPEIRYGTAACYKPCLKRIKEYFGGEWILDVQPEDIAEFMGYLKKKGYSAKTITNTKSVLQMIFDHWRFDRKYKGRKTNPVAGYKLPAGLPRSDRMPPTEEQIRIIKDHPEGFGIAPNFFAYSGLRLGELVALQWRDIDFERNLIHVTKTCSWHGNQPVIGPTKTKNSVRDVPLLRPLRNLLIPLIPSRVDGLNYILGGGLSPMTNSAYRNAWEVYCYSLGMATRERVTYGKYDKYRYHTDVTAHQFRHDFASALYEAGIGEMEAQVILGHADIVTTRKIYTHIRQRQLDKAATTLNDFFSKQK